MKLKPYRFLSDRTRLIIRTAFGSLLLLSLFLVVREVTCDWNCDAHRAAQRHVDALANNDYDSYVANMNTGGANSVEDFEFQLNCLDWSRVKVGKVYDSELASDIKLVALHAPSGDFFLTTNIRPPVGNAMEGKGFEAYAAAGFCPSDLDELPQTRSDED